MLCNGYHVNIDIALISFIALHDETQLEHI
jgi:hypothetical protein